MSNYYVGVVFVNYNGLDNQIESIKSLRKSTFTNMEYIVVDNGSTDGSVDKLKEVFPEKDVHVIDTQNNSGFAGGTNVGIKYSIELGTTHTLVINNDIEVAPELVIKLLEKTNENRITVPKIMYYDNPELTWYVGGEMKWKIGQGIHWNYNQKDTHEFDKDTLVSYASGCCMMIPNAIFDKVGYFPEEYFMYFEDADYCVQLAEHAVEMLYVHDALMWHKVCSSTGGEDSPLQTYYMNRNKLFFMRKYKKYIPFTAFCYTYLKAVAKIICSPVYKRNNKYITKAMLDYFKRKPGMVKKL